MSFGGERVPAVEPPAADDLLHPLFDSQFPKQLSSEHNEQDEQIKKMTTHTTILNRENARN